MCAFSLRAQRHAVRFFLYAHNASCALFLHAHNATLCAMQVYPGAGKDKVSREWRCSPAVLTMCVTIDVMAQLRTNKRRRRKYRRWAAADREEAELIELEDPARADQLRRITGLWDRPGSPMKSRKRRSNPSTQVQANTPRRPW
jgi:hypothetical protein